MKWWAIYTNLPLDGIVTLSDLRRGDSLRRESFLASSAEKQIYNYHMECSMHHPSLSTLSLKGLSLSKVTSWAINTNLPVNAIVSLSHSQSKDSQGRKKFLAPSANKKTCNYDKECSNHNYSISTMREKRLGCSKMIYCAIYTNYGCQSQNTPSSEWR